MSRALRHVQRCLERQVQHSELNAFVTAAKATQLQDAANAIDDVEFDHSALAGKTIAIKDNIVTKDYPTTASSKVLDAYNSPYNATVVDKLASAGALICGKTNLDEFGMGSHTRPIFTSTTRSPFVRNGQALSSGGSSGGSAVAVATGQAWAALGTDTGGSVRLPAAYTDTVGFKPSYGRLSRWGVIAYANSLDTVGTLTQTVGHARDIFNVLDRFDHMDPTSLSKTVRDRIASQTTAWSTNRKLRIGIPLDYNTASLSPEVRQTWSRLLSTMQDAGHSLHPVSLPSTHQALSAYYVLAPAEASSNLAKYDGVRYGYRTSGADANPKDNLPLFAATRGEGFGPEVQRRILLGAYTLSSEAMDNYFVQAQRVRRLVQMDFDTVFALQNPLLDARVEQSDDASSVDVLIAPTAPTLPPTLAEVEKLSPVEMYMNDVLTVPASLAGLPALSVPVKLKGGAKQAGDVDSVGMQVIGQFGDDEFVLQVGQIIEGLQA
ncbi:A subunit of putative glutamyl-tRNA amidotransferase [Aureobasidium sp. EXF-8845]|nr:A subunit of putative glutamyl-tRNA amidotransferase [Aureobasidium sp. EXF-8845]KAI4857249.1 A subunit of putative glutamyl-tRNA amidotransferase [Aureobasidium sp. EXF-8846]